MVTVDVGVIRAPDRDLRPEPESSTVKVLGPNTDPTRVPVRGMWVPMDEPVFYKGFSLAVPKEDALREPAPGPVGVIPVCENKDVPARHTTVPSPGVIGPGEVLRSLPDF